MRYLTYIACPCISYALERDLTSHSRRDGNEVVQQQPAIPQNEYQRSLDTGLPPAKLTTESVRYWSDFNRVFYHPRSIVQLNEYDLGSQIMPFEDWTTGNTLFKDIDKDQDILDRDIRPFAEECDQLKAIQVFSGIEDAWGGFASSYIERLKDEYGSKSIWVWGLESERKPERVISVPNWPPSQIYLRFQKILIRTLAKTITRDR